MIADFGNTKDKKPVQLATIVNKNGMCADISSYGATLVSLLAPDKNGKLADVVLGFDNVTGYENTDTYMGATIGRHAGQIANGSFVLNDRQYDLVINDHNHTMHGGPEGFHNQIFDIAQHNENTVTFSRISRDGEANFPGDLEITVTYIIADDNSLSIDFNGCCKVDTILSMTNHAYFNLDGPGCGDILSHSLKIYADEYTVVDNQGLPTGEILPVADTPFDFREFRTIGERIAEPHTELKYCSGYDHNWVISNPGEVRLCCELMSSDRMRHMRLYTNQPGLQMYSGNYLKGAEGKAGSTHVYRGALCLEPQMYPNGLNHPHFPSPVLKGREVYRYRSIYKF
ncbi:MAG: galactose mutarotase [Defluviitaleaceae bacterium]|nr:galactose mutarotase [Defluviitaleaceae bacterium]